MATASAPGKRESARRAARLAHVFPEAHDVWTHGAISDDPDVAQRIVDLLAEPVVTADPLTADQLRGIPARTLTTGPRVFPATARNRDGDSPPPDHDRVLSLDDAPRPGPAAGTARLAA